MPYLLIRCQVVNPVHWASVVADQIALLRANGVQSIQLFASADDPHEVVGLIQWDDLDRARLFTQSDELPEMLARVGVVEQPDLWFLEEIDAVTVVVDGEARPWKHLDSSI